MSSDAGKGLIHSSRFTESGLRVAEDVLGLVEKTPLVRLARLAPPGGGTVWAKVEFVNPAGSVKDRPALSMILAAEKSGELKPGATLIEATSGNTGISLAMIAAVRGYRCLLVMPEDMSLERRYILRAYGAEIVLTPAGDGMSGAVSKAMRLLQDTPGAFMPSQFENPANPASHESGTALEILEQTGNSIAAFVSGVGTGGTISGVGRTLKNRLGGAVKVFAVEPANSAVLSGKPAGMHGIQGLGAGFVPEILDRSVIDQILEVTDVAAERMARRLAREEGLLVGPSSGANVHAACEVAAQLKGGNVVTILCDSGERYLF
ncbi:MAG TPA: cysteine synthase A [Polyangiaceae bacterium]|jgi:cysteine synthase A|nr:cysteine synthase A [Polyangiaceae bacterium]